MSEAHLCIRTVKSTPISRAKKENVGLEFTAGGPDLVPNSHPYKTEWRVCSKQYSIKKPACRAITQG